MGSRGPVPKRSNMRHGHSKPEPVTKLPAARRWTDDRGGIHYDVVAPEVIPCLPVPRVYYTPGGVRIRIPADPDEEG